MSTVYNQRYDGEWVDVTDERLVACCDCGLVHSNEYTILDGRILRRAFRNKRATANRRRMKTVKASIRCLNRKKAKA